MQGSSLMEAHLTHEPRWWGFRIGKAVAVALLIFVLYVFSAGPVWWLHKHGGLSKSAFSAIYQPIGYFAKHSQGDIFSVTLLGGRRSWSFEWLRRGFNYGSN